MSLLRDEKGSAFVYCFVCLVVLSLILMGMLQTAAMTYRAARSQENRQRAFSAAESGLAVGMAAMTGGVALERRDYGAEPPSIDSAADDWLGGDSGNAPACAILSDGARYSVWLSPQGADGLSTLISKGECGSSSRVVEVTVREPRLFPAHEAIAAAAKSPGPAVHLKGLLKVKGDIRVESADVESLKIETPWWDFLSLLIDLDGDLIVGKGADKPRFVKKFRRYLREESIQVADDVRAYPAAIVPEDLPKRSGIDQWSIDRVTISESGDYPFIKLKGINQLRFVTGDTGNPLLDDIAIRVRGDFEMAGISSIKVSGKGKVRMYVDGDIKELGVGFVGGLFGDADPLRLWIYCGGKHVNLLKGVGATSCMVYAPDAKVSHEAAAIHGGAIVCDQFEAEGAAYYRWNEAWRQHDFEPEGRRPIIVPGSWRERR